MFAQILKSNPYHDVKGLFTTKDKAGHAQLQARILARVLPHPDERAEFLIASARAEAMFKSGESSKRLHTKPGTNSYTSERLKLHREILHKLLGNDFEHLPNPNTRPRMILIGGRTGAGKSVFDSENNAQLGVYNQKRFVVLDPDKIKGLLPEYKPEEAVFTHAESTDIFNKAIHAAKARGLNVVMDFTMSHDKSDLVRQFKEVGYQTEAYYIHKPVEMAAASAIERWKNPVQVERLDGMVETFKRNRIVPLDVIMRSTNNDKNFEKLKKRVDTWQFVDNSSGQHDPKVTAGNVLKSNPFHDAKGKFTSKNLAVWVDSLPQTRGWKRVGGQGGSNPGGQFEDPSGVRHYVKFPQRNPEQAQAERLSDSIYRELGIPVKNSQLVGYKGKLGLAGEMLDGEERGREHAEQSPDIHRGYVADAFLANWDVFGLTYDNVLTSGGRDYRVDNGGTLFFRAQGEKKNFPSDRVDELESLIAPGKKGHTAFASLTQEQKKAQAQQLVSTLTTTKLVQLVADAGFTGSKAKQYVATLRGRRNAIAQRFGIEQPKFKKVLKSNPYHDKTGRFSNKQNAVPGGWYQSKSGKSTMHVRNDMVVGGSNKTHNVPAEKQYLGAGPFKTQAQAQAHPTPHAFNPSKYVGGPKIPSFPPVSGSPVKAIPSPVVTSGGGTAHTLTSPPVVKPTPPVQAPVASQTKPTQSLESAKNAALAAGKAAKTNSKITGNTVTGNVEQFQHEFFSNAKAQAGFTTLIDAYQKAGFSITANTPSKPGEIKLTLETFKVKAQAFVGQEIKPVEQKPATVADVAKVVTPVTPAMTAAKAKGQAAQLAKYTDKYLAEAVVRRIEAMDLKKAGQNSKAAAKLAPLETIKKELAKYGITPEGQDALKKQVDDKIEGMRQALKAKMLAANIELTRLENNFGTPERKAAWDALSAIRKEHPGLVDQSKVSTEAVDYVHAKQYEALQSIAKLDKVVGNEPAFAEAKHWGVNKDQIGLAVETGEFNKALRNAKTQYATVAEAEVALKAAAHAVGYENQKSIWNEPDEVKKEHQAKVAILEMQQGIAKAAYVKSGGMVDQIDSLKKIGYSSGSKAYYADAEGIKNAKKQLKTELTDVAAKWHQAKFEHGENSQQAQSALADLNLMHTAPMTTKYLSKAEVEFASSSGKALWDEQIKVMKEQVQSSIAAKMYEHHYNILTLKTGDPAIKTSEYEVAHAMQSNVKFFQSNEFMEMDTHAKNMAKATHDSMERLKTLGADVQKRVLDYDKNGASFAYPTGDKLARFHSHNLKQSDKMTGSEKSVIKDYMGDAYKGINKSLGAMAAGGKPTGSQAISNIKFLEMAFDRKPTLGENVKLNRTMASKYIATAFGLENLPKTESELKSLEGRVYTENAYSSTSWNEDWTSGFAKAANTSRTLLKIRASADMPGLKVGGVVGNSGEGEVLLPRGATYVIRKAYFQTSKWGDSRHHVFEVDLIGYYAKPVNFGEKGY